MPARAPANPFRFGALARDEAFTDRDAEVAELLSDARNGQDVVIFAPRRFGKTSLVDRVQQHLVRADVLVGQVNLMRTPTKEKLAEKLAGVVYEDIAGPLTRARDFGARLFRGLRITPTMTVDPEDGSLSFSFAAGHQPEVAHFYLGSKRHMMQRIYNDEQEPFWRSAKKVELGPIAPEPFAVFITQRFAATGRRIAPEVVDRVLVTTGGHPYATQELCYFLWEETPGRQAATPARLDVALAKVLRSEHTHFSLLWDRAASAQKVVLQALAREPGRPLSQDYGRRHRLPSASSTQKALEALERDELVGRDHGRAWIAEPFLAEWIRAEAE